MGYLIFSLIGLKRTLFTNIFQRLLKGQPVVLRGNKEPTHEQAEAEAGPDSIGVA